MEPDPDNPVTGACAVWSQTDTLCYDPILVVTPGTRHAMGKNDHVFTWSVYTLNGLYLYLLILMMVKENKN